MNESQTATLTEKEWEELERFWVKEYEEAYVRRISQIQNSEEEA